MELAATAPSANGTYGNDRPRPVIRAGIAPSAPRPVHESSVQDFGLLDQLHSIYADRSRMETAIGLSDADDIISHVMHLRREHLAAKADVRTAMDMLASVLQRLDSLS
jgi:hypothetical protein